MLNLNRDKEYTNCKFYPVLIVKIIFIEVKLCNPTPKHFYSNGYPVAQIIEFNDF